MVVIVNQANRMILEWDFSGICSTKLRFCHHSDEFAVMVHVTFSTFAEFLSC